MWSTLLQDLIEAADSDILMDSPQQVSPSPTIALTDTAADFLLLLGCIYPSPARTTITSANALHLLQLADKYHCPDIISRCAAFIVDHVLPRLACSSTCDNHSHSHDWHPDSSARTASPLPGQGIRGGSPVPAAPGADSLDWVLSCLGLAVRLELDELAQGCATLLGRKFWQWELQELGAAAALAGASLSPELLLRMMAAIPPPQALQQQGQAAEGSTLARAGGGGAQRQAAAGGHRIIPVAVAGAGAAAAAGAPAPVPVAGAHLHHQHHGLQPEPMQAPAMAQQVPMMMMMGGGLHNGGGLGMLGHMFGNLGGPEPLLGVQGM